jgi:protein disulfide-isomerase A6
LVAGCVTSARACFLRRLNAQVFKPGSGVNPYTGGALKHFDQYGGPGSAKALMTAVTDQLNASQITQLNTSDAASTLLASEPRLAKVLLFTDKPASTVLYKALAWAYVRRLVAAEVRPSDDAGKALAEHYGVTAYPTLLVVKVRLVGAHTHTPSCLAAPQRPPRMLLH